MIHHALDMQMHIMPNNVQMIHYMILVVMDMMRQYLFYIYGKFVSADIYAGCIGGSMADADDEWKMLLDSIMDEAITKITEI